MPVAMGQHGVANATPGKQDDSFLAPLGIGLLVFRVCLGVFGKLCITMTFNAIYTWSAELYPTAIRGAGMGYLQIAARIGSAVAPWVVKWLIGIHIMLSFSLMGGSAVICAILLCWLPETAHMKTMETLQDQFD